LESPVRHDNITTAYIPHHRPKNCPEPPLAIAPQPSETGYETEKGEEQKLKEEEIPKKKPEQRRGRIVVQLSRTNSSSSRKNGRPAGAIVGQPPFLFFPLLLLCVQPPLFCK